MRDVERGSEAAEPSFRRVQDSCEGVLKVVVSCAMGAATTADWEGCFRDRDR